MSVDVGKITIFKNDPGPEGKRPTFNIKFELNGTEYEAGLWRKKTKAGDPYYSGNIKQQTKLESVPNNSVPAPKNDQFDEIPF